MQRLGRRGFADADERAIHRQPVKSCRLRPSSDQERHPRAVGDGLDLCADLGVGVRRAAGVLTTELKVAEVVAAGDALLRYSTKSGAVSSQHRCSR